MMFAFAFASLCGLSMLSRQVEGKTDDHGYTERQMANANVLVKDGLEVQVRIGILIVETWSGL